MRLSDLQSDARPLAVVRIGLGLATVLNALEMFGLLREIAGGKMAMPVLPWIPTPTIGVLVAYLAVACSAGLAIALGYRTSAAATLSTFLNVGVLLADQQTYSSHRLLATALVAYLIFARSDTMWSLASRQRGTSATVPWSDAAVDGSVQPRQQRLPGGSRDHSPITQWIGQPGLICV